MRKKRIVVKLNDREDEEIYRVLLVEDGAIDSTVVKIILADLGCFVDVAGTAEDAKKFYQTHHYDLILMDVGLPEVDGYAVTRSIRQTEIQSGGYVPIVALTTHRRDEENREKCLTSGMNAVIIKPLIPENAEEVLKAFIPYRPATEEQVRNRSLNHFSSPLPDTGIIDFECLLNRFDNKMDFVQEILILLVDSIRDELLKIQEAFEAQDFNHFKNLVHKLKGGAVYCCANLLNEACEQCEHALKNRNKSNHLDQAMRCLEKASEQVVRTIQARRTRFIT